LHLDIHKCIYGCLKHRKQWVVAKKTKQTKQAASAGTPEKLQFDWDLVQSFLTVIDEGSLLAAARVLGRSQPTMGRHIDLLENQLGVVLFERTARALVPTDRALAVASAAREMQNGADQVCRLIQSQDETLSGVVRVSASRIVATQLLPKLMPRIQQVAPELDIAIVATDEVSNLLRRDADIAVRMVRPKQASLIAKRLGEIKIIPCASQSYINRWGLPRSPQEIFNHKLVGSDNLPEMLMGLSRLATAFGLEKDAARIVFRSDDFVTQAAAIKSGVGIGFLAQFMIDKDDAIQPLPFDLAIPALPVWLAVHREIRTTPRIRLVFDELTSLLKENTSG